MAQTKSTSQTGGHDGSAESGDNGEDNGSSKAGGAGIAGFAEQVASRILNPLELVILTRDRLQETLDDAVERGRMTRTDANELVSELLRIGRQQTEDVLAQIEHLLGLGRGQIESATRRARQVEPVDRIVQAADRARRTVGGPATFPIAGYDDLTARQVGERLGALSAGELRRVREYELRHANRKSVLEAIEKALDAA